MKILILEDDHERIKSFKRKYVNHSLVFTEHSADAIDWLAKETFDYIFLDHDLGGTQMNFDPEDCGTLVAEYIVKNNIQDKSQIIIHSFNQPAAMRMVDIINDNVQYIPGLWLKTNGELI